MALGEAAFERDADAHTVADPHFDKRGVPVPLTALVALALGATEREAHEDGGPLRELHEEALGDTMLEREIKGDSLVRPLAVWRGVLLTLAVTPDAEDRGDKDALRVPDAHAEGVLDEDAHADTGALRDAHPVELGEAAPERDAEAQSVAVAHIVESGVAVTLKVPVALKVGAADGEARKEKEVLCEEQEDALGDEELEREDAGLLLRSMLAV